MKVFTYYLNHINSTVNRWGCVLLTAGAMATPFLVVRFWIPVLSPLLFACLGLLLEELLHLVLILFSTKSEGIKFRVVLLKGIPVSFSWFVPDDTPMLRKKVAVMVPPVAVVLLGFALGCISYKVAGLGAFPSAMRGFLLLYPSSFSLVPFSYGIIRSDAAQFLMLQRETRRNRKV